MRRIAAAKQDRTLVDIEPVPEKYSDKNSQRANNVTALINKEKSQGGLWKANDG
jgi:hypothetical protein